MPLEPLRLTYRLNRRQQLAAHLGIWMHCWPAFVGVGVTPAAVVALAFRFSFWFL